MHTTRTTWRNAAIAAAIAGLGLSTHAIAQTAPMGSAMSGGMSASGAAMSRASDRMFFKKAAIGGMTEVELSKVAQEKGSSDAVKQYSAKMIEDHTKANDELKQIASAQSMELPSGLDAKGQQKKDGLEKLSGAAFDRKYMSIMRSDHQETVALFQKESHSGKNPEAKDFATRTLPVIQEHLKMIPTMASGMKSAMK